jgi:hypothetical protein
MLAKLPRNSIVSACSCHCVMTRVQGSRGVASAGWLFKSVTDFGSRAVRQYDVRVVALHLSSEPRG